MQSNQVLGEDWSIVNDWMTQLGRINAELRNAVSAGRLMDRDVRRRFLQERVGQIRQLRRLDEGALQRVLQGRPLLGVDGSVNTYGGQFPYWLALLRALAKCSDGRTLEFTDTFTPLLASEAEHKMDPEAAEGEKKSRLAALEAQAALSGCEQYSPTLMILDGSFIRFDKEAGNSFKMLKEAVGNTETLVIGVIEGIASRVIPSLLGTDGPEGWQNRYDRELLWGVLEYGEVLEVHSSSSKEGVRTWFMRSSLDPGVVGLDILEEQVDLVQRRPELIDYLFTITPPDGRGIPIWNDIVDQEVRLTDTEVETVVGAALDREVIETLLSAKREARVL